ARGVSSPDNCSSICVEGTLIEVNPLSHYWKPKGWKSLGKLEKHKPSYESIPSDSNPKQGDEASNEATASTGGVRRFTNLLAVLVCEVLARLDAKELGIVSCVSTLLHALATDHQGCEKLYCERWGLSKSSCHPERASGSRWQVVPWMGSPGKRLGRCCHPRARLGMFLKGTLRGVDFSGSWDMTVRVWDRAQMECVRKLMHADWVWDLALRGNTVASTAGSDAYVWDIRNGELTSLISNAHVGCVYSLARTHLADVLFTGGEDGAIRLFNVSVVSDDEDIKPVATWVPHSGPPHSLAFEYPWLVSASSDGRIALIDLRKLLTPKKSSKGPLSIKSFDASAIEAPQMMLHGFRCDLFSITIGADRIVCAGEHGAVRIWNFSEALEIEKREQALRSLRQENRMRRRKAQVEMNANGRRPEQCSIAMKKNQLKGDKSATRHNERVTNEKVKS
ncbi:hypothetical protein U9M48_020288, partial [Paspalum notatum var. saurae]